MKTITGSQILTMRKKLGLNQMKFWNRIGVTQSGGSRYESGRTIPRPVSMLLSIAYGNARDSERAIKQLRAK